METETEATTKTIIAKEDIDRPFIIPQSTEEKEQETTTTTTTTTTTEKRKREGEAEEGSDRGPLWKTSLCSYFRSKQGCSHGESCRYAHGEEELRPRPDKTWDPTSERAKKPQRKANESEEEEEEEEEGLDETNLDKCLIGLPRNWGSDNLNKFLDGQGIPYKSAKKKKRMAVAFVVFENVEQVKDAIKILNEKSDGGKQIKIANATRRSNEKRQSSGTTQGLPVNESHDEDNDAADNETSVTEGLVPKTRSARDVVTPLAHMPYTDQLEHKKNSLLQTLKRLVRKIRLYRPFGF